MVAYCRLEAVGAVRRRALEARRHLLESARVRRRRLDRVHRVEAALRLLLTSGHLNNGRAAGLSSQSGVHRYAPVRLPLPQSAV